MHWIYLSPHFDDVALSCGGLVWQQVQAGDAVHIWTICAGVPDPSQRFSPFAQALHERWGTGPASVAARRAEDIASCQVLGAAYRHLPVYDCIYRGDGQGQYYYASEEALNGPLHPDEASRAAQLTQLKLEHLLAGVRVVCPLSLGNHVDHQLTRLAAEQTGCQLWYYADYPYVLRQPGQLQVLEQEGWRRQCTSLSPGGLKAWQDCVAAHASQISTFWADEAAMRAAIAEYSAQEGAVCLWQWGG
jgi:LmbE family N-acetylglucosaminyl deacetylase